MHFSNSIRKHCWLPAQLILMRCDGYCANARAGRCVSLSNGVNEKKTHSYVSIDWSTRVWVLSVLVFIHFLSSHGKSVPLANIAFYKQRSHDIVTVKVEFSPGQFQECSTIFVHKCQANVLRVECAKVCSFVYLLRIPRVCSRNWSESRAALHIKKWSASKISV